MKKSYIAALIRGLCIDLTGKPQTVVTQECSCETPPCAMKLEINCGETEAAAALIRSAYNEWKKSNAACCDAACCDAACCDAAGTGSAADNMVPLPSCAVLTANGKTEALFWIDNDLDSAQKRLAQNSVRFETRAVKSNIVDPAQRASVVKNRVALVTGGAQGIGEEIVRNLAAAGAIVFIADLNLEGAKKLAEQINSAEKRTCAIAVEVNVANEGSVQAMFDTAAETTGGIDLCISNAGVLKAGSVLEQELSEFKFVTDINYTAFFIISKFAGRLLRTQHLTAPDWKTDIIQVNSKSGLEGSNKNGAYAGGKFGSLGLVASFALELVDYNIKVNAVCPGNFLDGPLWSDPDKGLFVQYLKTGKVPGAKSIADVRAFYESKVPMKRGCTGKDLIRAIYYIVEQEYETGQAVPVTGGQVMLH